MSTKGYSAGFAYAQFWVPGATGLCQGVQSTLGAGIFSSAYMMFDVKTANLTYVNPTNLNIHGGDKTVSILQFGNMKLGNFQIACSLLDVDNMIALFTGATPNTTNSTSAKFSINPNLTFPMTLGMALTQRFQGKTGSDGGARFHTMVIPNAMVRMKLNAFNFQGEADVMFEVTPNMTDQAPIGGGFGSTGLNFNLEQGITDHYDMITNNPVHFAAFAGNGALTSFSTPYLPTSSVVTLATTPNEYYVSNGTATALTSVSTSTALFTMPTVLASLAQAQLVYQTRFVTYP